MGACRWACADGRVVMGMRRWAPVMMGTGSAANETGVPIVMLPPGHLYYLLPHLDCAEVVGADGYQRALAAQVLVQLVLQVDEALVAGGIKGDAPQHSAHHKGAHLHISTHMEA
eukprot:1160006-Pelagomonas_calceolata.AAC.9